MSLSTPFIRRTVATTLLTLALFEHVPVLLNLLEKNLDSQEDRQAHG
ncbi:hypothetical protein HKT28_35940, partial [Pseudomonas aeruginosa]|nr:hypothetical protein [Pseudomonas aeruginosa]